MGKRGKIVTGPTLFGVLDQPAGQDADRCQSHRVHGHHNPWLRNRGFWVRVATVSKT